MSNQNVAEEPKKRTITAEHKDFKKVTGKEGAPSQAEIKKKTKGKEKKAKAAATKSNIGTAAKKTDKKATNSETERESKYAYTADCKTAKDKKEFRRKARATAKKYEADLKKLKKATDAKGIKEYQAMRKEKKAWLTETYTSAPVEEKEAA